MKNFKMISPVVLVLLMTVMASHPTMAEPTDTAANAEIITLNNIYNGTMEQYNDKQYYNFTGASYRTYNFTFWQAENNVITLSLYDSEGNFLDYNSSTSYTQKYLLWTGLEDYTVLIAGTEFAEYPVDYNITVTEYIGEPGKGVASAIEISNGSVDGTFTESLDEYWYNFTSDPDHLYNVTMTLPEGNYSTFQIYNSSMDQLGTIYDSSGYQSFEVTGDSEYVIRAVADFEFMEFPNEFTITIVDLDVEVESTPTTSSNIVTSPTESLDTKETLLTITSDTPSFFSLNFSNHVVISLFIVVGMVRVIQNRKK